MLDSSPEIILSFDNIRTTRAQKFMSNVLIKQIHMYCFNPREKHNHKKHNHKIIINPGDRSNHGNPLKIPISAAIATASVPSRSTWQLGTPRQCGRFPKSVAGFGFFGRFFLELEITSWN